jgi:hypothetical protein
MEFLDGGTVLQTLEVTQITELNMAFITSEVIGIEYSPLFIYGVI